MSHARGTFTYNILFNPPSNYQGRCHLSPLHRWEKLRPRKIQLLTQSLIASQENVRLIPKLSDSKPCTSLTTSVCPLKENQYYSDKIRPESRHLLLRVMVASLGTNIRGNETTRGMPAPLLNCFLYPRADFFFYRCLHTSLFCGSVALPIPTNRHWDSLVPSLPCCRSI